MAAVPPYHEALSRVRDVAGFLTAAGPRLPLTVQLQNAVQAALAMTRRATLHYHEAAGAPGGER
ncbi:MAG TPA: hypothetical protein VM076_14905 [Gemmatimonadaceae bacterium]|nr:hypothetical protein [Gemmatimonadaceae bacterium]